MQNNNALVRVGLWVIRKEDEESRNDDAWCAAARPPVPGKRVAL
jgi:hypothetical protein